MSARLVETGLRMSLCTQLGSARTHSLEVGGARETHVEAQVDGGERQMYGGERLMYQGNGCGDGGGHGGHARPGRAETCASTGDRSSEDSLTGHAGSTSRGSGVGQGSRHTLDPDTKRKRKHSNAGDSDAGGDTSRDSLPSKNDMDGLLDGLSSKKQNDSLSRKVSYNEGHQQSYMQGGQQGYQQGSGSFLSTAANSTGGQSGPRGEGGTHRKEDAREVMARAHDGMPAARHPAGRHAGTGPRKTSLGSGLRNMPVGSALRNTSLTLSDMSFSQGAVVGEKGQELHGGNDTQSGGNDTQSESRESESRGQCQVCLEQVTTNDLRVKHLGRYLHSVCAMEAGLGTATGCNHGMALKLLPSHDLEAHHLEAFPSDNHEPCPTVGLNSLLHMHPRPHTLQPRNPMQASGKRPGAGQEGGHIPLNDIMAASIKDCSGSNEGDYFSQGNDLNNHVNDLSLLSVSPIAAMRATPPSLPRAHGMARGEEGGGSHMHSVSKPKLGSATMSVAAPQSLGSAIMSVPAPHNLLGPLEQATSNPVAALDVIADGRGHCSTESVVGPGATKSINLSLPYQGESILSSVHVSPAHEARAADSVSAG